MRLWLGMRLAVVAVVVAAGCNTSHEKVEPNSNALVIVGGHVLDPSSDAPPIAATVVVIGDKIVAVGPDVKAPAGAQEIDASGKYIVPGLWDMHAHLDAVNSVGFKPEGYVGHGVLGIRDMGGHLDKLLALKRELADGRIGPELVIAGPTLNGEAFADFQRAVATTDEARAAVRELKAVGVGLIKVHRATRPDVFLAIVDEARKAGLPVAGHVPLGMSWVEAADAGIQSIEHMVTIVENEMADPVRPAANILAAVARVEGPEGEAMIAALVRNHTYLDPTLIHYERRLQGAAPETAAAARGFYMKARAMVGRAHAGGVPILAGSDETERPGAALLDELDLLVASGLSPREALKAATANAAIAAGLPKFGRIEAGAPASLLILDANPELDVSNVRKLSMVVLRGQVLDAVALARLREMDVAEGRSGVSP